MNRRDFLKYGLGLVSSAAMVDWSHLAALRRDSRYMDRAAIADLHELTWEYGERSHSMSPTLLLPAVDQHLLGLRAFASDASDSDRRRRLVAVAGETAALAGRLAYQSDSHGQAETYYNLAERCGLEAGDNAIRTQAYVGLSYLSSTVACGGDKSDGRALALLDHAADTGGNSPVLRTWVLARRAEEQAARGSKRNAAEDLEAAQAALDQAQGAERGMLSQWGQPWLDAYQANVHLLTGEPGMAEKINSAALTGLPQSLLYQRSALLSDIARAQAQQGSLDEACASLEHALHLASQQGAQVRLQHVRRARGYLGTVDTQGIRHLDEALRQVAG